MSIVSPELNVYFNCKTGGKKGYITLNYVMRGDVLHKTVVATPITITYVIRGNPPKADVLANEDGAAIAMAYDLKGEAVANRQWTNWVAWSKIGTANFKLDLVNDAGYRPMSWDGYCLAILQMGKNAIVYGTNGVTALYPVNTTFGFQELLPIGIKSKNAVAGDDKQHFFIDRNDQLWTLSSKGMVRLDYAEHLSALVNPQMFFDADMERLLISDADIGFVYTKNGLGGGYGNLTGYVRDGGAIITTSVGTNGIDRPWPSITTSPLDFGQRGTKTLTSVHCSTDTPEVLELAYDFRVKSGEAWRTTRWVPFNRFGTAFLRCSAIEFRIKVRAKLDILDEAFSMMIDYLNVNVQFSDQRFKRGAGSGRASNRERQEAGVI